MACEALHHLSFAPPPCTVAQELLELTTTEGHISYGVLMPIHAVTLEQVTLGCAASHLPATCRQHVPPRPAQVPRPMPEDDAYRAYSELGEGLSHMHSNGYCHADVKPSNGKCVSSASRAVERAVPATKTVLCGSSACHPKTARAPSLPVPSHRLLVACALQCSSTFPATCSFATWARP